MRYLTELICQLYRLTDHHKLTAATFKNLADIKLVKPTADADTILQLENIFREGANKGSDAQWNENSR